MMELSPPATISDPEHCSVAEQGGTRCRVTPCDGRLKERGKTLGISVIRGGTKGEENLYKL